MKPSLFKSTLLGDALKFFNGKSIKPGGDGEFPVYGSNGLIGQSDEYTHHNGLIIGRVGAYCGAIKYCGTHFWASDNTIVGKPKDASFDIRYMYYLLRELNLNRYAGGSAQPLLTQTVLRQIPVSIPPLPTQRKIASILSAYDDLIENNARRIKILEDMAATIYRKWFVEFRFPGHENIPMVESELGPIPQGWAVMPLGEMCHVLMGQSPKSEFYNETGEGLPFHQGVTDFGNRFPTERVYCTVENRIAKAGDILFSVRAPVGRINIANKKIVIGRGLAAIRSNSGYQAFLFQQLHDKFREQDSMGGGTIFNAITKGDLMGIQLLKPTESKIAHFEEIVEPIFSKLANLTLKNTNLRQARDLLLPKLISGEIDVSELDIDTEGT